MGLEENGDGMVNRGMVYEVGVMKREGEGVVEEVGENWEEYGEG